MNKQDAQHLRDVQEQLAEAWDEGFRQGKLSSAGLSIRASENPYRADQPAATETGPLQNYPDSAREKCPCGDCRMWRELRAERLARVAETAPQGAPEPLDENWLATRRPAGGKGSKP